MRSRLRVLRAKRRWTQQDLAREVGVSRQTIHAIEAEKCDPGLPLAFEIAALLDMPIRRIFKPALGPNVV